MRSVVGGAAVVILMLSACSSSSDPTPSGATPSASATSSTATGSERDLGPDPGSVGYRSLDVCALVSVTALQAAYSADGGSGSVQGQASGPAMCTYKIKDSGAWVRLSLDSPRHQLPADVRTTDAGINKVDTAAAGVIVYDPAVASLHVLSSSGYLLRVDGPGDTLDAQRLAMTLARSVRDRLSQPPPTLDLPSSALSARDLCAVVRETDVAGALGLRGEVEASADGRLCELPKQFWVSFHVRQDFPPGVTASTVPIGSVDAAVRDDRCQVVIPIGAAPKGARWEYESLLASAEPRTGSECAQFLKALTPVVESLMGTGQSS